jgi:hypothetical protein
MKKTFTIIELIICIVIFVIIGVLVLGFFGVAFTGCTGGVETGASTLAEMEQTEENHARLIKAVPPPQLTTSQERINLVKRLKRFNSENKVSYVYLISFGKVMAFITVQGKVSSVDSLLTTPTQVVTLGSGSALSTGTDKRVTRHAVASPSLDGSYGTNGTAVFFFTTEDTFVEWSGEYLWTDAPTIKLSTPPTIIIDETVKAPEKAPK